MSESARQRRSGQPSVPRIASPEEKTRELPAAAIPEQVRTDEDTVPVHSSLENILRHEMLRHQSERDDDEDTAAPGDPAESDAGDE
jgi:hypothetical protein